MENNALVPVKQSLVPFYGNKILSARLYDGRIAVSMNSLCKMFKLAKHGQIERIRRDEELKEYLLLILVKTPGGSQRINALVAEAIPSWVRGIQDNLIAPEKRPLIRSLKVEFILILYRHFFAEEVAEPAPEQEAPAPAAKAPLSGIAQIKQAASLFVEGVNTLEAERQEERSRRAALEEDTDQRLLLIEQAFKDHIRPVQTFPGLPPDRIVHLYVLLRRLRSQRGTPIAEALAALAAEFAVADASDVPESAWPDLVAWFERQNAGQ